MRSSFLASAATMTILLSPAIAAQGNTAIPDIAQALLDAAYETGDAAEIEAVTRAVKQVFPDYADAIEDDAADEIAVLAPPEPEAAEDDAAAGEPPDDPSGGIFAFSPWEGKIQAGGSFASGNSDNLALGFALDAARTTGDFTHNITGFYDLAESDGDTTQDRWGVAYQLDYNFSDYTYAFGRLSYEDDAFSGFEYRAFAGAGIGHFFYKTEPFTWKIEGGPGFRYSPIEGSDEVNQNFAAYAASELDWIIREGVIFGQDVNVTWTSPTTTFQSITSLTTQLTDAIATSISVEYRYETDPPLGRVNSDTIARASLVYGF